MATFDNLIFTMPPLVAPRQRLAGVATAAVENVVNLAARAAVGL